MPTGPTRPDELIALLDLRPHPEGGFFSEIFRSERRVVGTDRNLERSAVTTIYFLLTKGDFSCWHVVESDEIWHFFDGHSLELLTIEPQSMRLTRRMLGRLEDGAVPVHTVPAGHWQAARSTGAYTLSGCTVAPGFEFDDMRFIRDIPEAARALRTRRPEVSDLL